MEYTILESRNTEGLIQKVNSAMSHGWKLTGGVAQDGNGYMQAMYRDNIDNLVHNLISTLTTLTTSKRKDHRIEAYH